MRTAAGTVLHTGDWKLDPDPLIGLPADEDALRRIGDEGVLGDDLRLRPTRCGPAARGRRPICAGR